MPVGDDPDVSIGRPNGPSAMNDASVNSVVYGYYLVRRVTTYSGRGAPATPQTYGFPFDDG
jgi:hypothetical protein